MYLFQFAQTDLPTPGKGKSGDPWKKIWRFLQKIVRFYFFFDQTPFSLREVTVYLNVTNLIPRDYPPFKMADSPGEKR